MTYLPEGNIDKIKRPYNLQPTDKYLRPAEAPHGLNVNTPC